MTHQSFSVHFTFNSISNTVGVIIVKPDGMPCSFGGETMEKAMAKANEIIQDSLASYKSHGMY
jgi:hypothetical protein